MPFIHRLLLCLAGLLFAAHTGGGSLFAQAQPADSLLVIGKITLRGNEKTKDYIVLRELAFKPGDTLAPSRLQLLRTRGLRQLFNLSLFISVDMHIAPPDSAGLTDVDIYLKERWYLFVIPIVEIADRNFNAWWINKDLSRLNLGARILRQNLRGRNETIRINIQGGYTRKFSVDYLFPYINKQLTIGSALNFTYSDNREVWAYTRNNKLQFFNDNDRLLYQRVKAGVDFFYRKKIYNTHDLGFEYNDLRIADTVAKQGVNPDYFLNGNTRQHSLYVSYKYTHDMRDFRQYALNGKFLSVEVGEYVFLNTPLNIFNAYLSASYHKKIADRHYWGASVDGKYSAPGRQPYNLYKALGYSYFVRGFEYNVIDGQHFALGKVNYIYNLLKQRYIHIPSKRFKKFRNIPLALYAKAFYDAGYVYDNYQLPTNTYSNSYLGGVGAGIDIITYYDRVFKLEYSLNNKGQRGLFLHFNMLF